MKKTINDAMLAMVTVAAGWGSFWTTEACPESESLPMGLLIVAVICGMKLMKNNDML